MAKKHQQPTALGTVTVAHYGAQGDEIARVVIPATVDDLAPLMGVQRGRVYAVVLENAITAPHATCTLRQGWTPPLLSPLWWRYQDRDLELVEEWVQSEVDELRREEADRRAVAAIEAGLAAEQRNVAELVAQVDATKVTPKKRAAARSKNMPPKKG